MRLLVRAIDNVNPSAPDSALYKRGDIVVVMPDGHVWGGLEQLPGFCRVDAPGEPQHHLRSEDRELAADVLPPAAVRSRRFAQIARATERKTKRRRRYWIDLDSIALDAEGQASLTQQQFDAALRDKRHAA